MIAAWGRGRMTADAEIIPTLAFTHILKGSRFRQEIWGWGKGERGRHCGEPRKSLSVHLWNIIGISNKSGDNYSNLKFDF